MLLGSFSRGARLLLLLLLLLLCTGASSSSWTGPRVYQLSTDGEADDPRRLVVELSDALGPTSSTSLASFTLCLWFKVATFLTFNTLLSYTLTDHTDSVLKILPRPSGLVVKYRENRQEHSLALRPLWWYATCVAVGPEAVTTWVSGQEDVLTHATHPLLPLNGSLLLGQKHDMQNTEYSSEIGFKGHVTDLNLWPLIMSEEEVLAWSRCQVVEATPLLAWHDLTSAFHNDTGDVSAHSEGPCGPEGPTGSEMLLFTNQMTWTEARAFMETNGMRMVAPGSPAELQEMTDLLARYKCYCHYRFMSSVWLGLTYNTTTGALESPYGVSVNISPTWHPKLMDLSKIEQCGSQCFVCLSTEGLWNIEGPTKRLCSVGVYTQPPPVFNLRVKSTDQKGEKSYTYYDFIMASTASKESDIGSVYFQGFEEYHIENDLASKTWFLRRRSRTGTTTVARVRHPGLPMGPLQWQVMDLWGLENEEEITQSHWEEGPMNLTLSTCTPSQYTCPDASCIPVSKVCDLEVDCEDGADEHGCFNTVLANGYNRDIPPQIPLPLLVKVGVRRIANIDLMNSAIQLDLEVNTWWRERRAEYRHLPFGPMKVFLWEGKLWLPELQVHNSLSSSAADGKPLVLVVQEEPGRLVDGEYYAFTGSGNRLGLQQILLANIYCRFDLRRYPADQQTCNIIIKVRNMKPEGLVIDPSSDVQECPTQLEEYDVQQCRILFAATSDNFTVQVTLQRRRDYHIWTTYLPSTFILAIGYGTLFLPAEFFNERGFMSLTTLLVFISLYTDTTSSLPHTAYIKHVDVWFVFSIVYLSLIITTHLATCSAALPQSPTAPPKFAVVQVRPRSLTYGKSEHPGEWRTCVPRVQVVLRTAKVVFGAVTVAFFCYYFTYA